jgi:hypothetical protein
MTATRHLQCRFTFACFRLIPDIYGRQPVGARSFVLSLLYVLSPRSSSQGSHLWLGRGGRYKDSQSALIVVSRALALYNYMNSGMPESPRSRKFSFTSFTSYTSTTTSSSTGYSRGIDSIVVTPLKPRPFKDDPPTTSKHDNESSQSSTHYDSDHPSNTKSPDRASSVDSMTSSIGSTSSPPASLKRMSASQVPQPGPPEVRRRNGMELERPVPFRAEPFPKPNAGSTLGNLTYWVALVSMLGAGAGNDGQGGVGS